MSDQAKALEVFLKKAEQEIKDGMASGSGVPFWEAAASALDVVKGNQGAIKNWGVSKFKTLLSSLSLTPAREQNLIKMMTARQLVLDMREGASTLEQDTARRESAKEEIVEILLKLGSIGAQLLVRLF